MNISQYMYVCIIFYVILQKLFFNFKIFTWKTTRISDTGNILCKKSFIIPTMKVDTSFFFFFLGRSKVIYIYSRSISIWSYETLTTDSLESRISMATNHRPLFISCRFRWEAQELPTPRFVIFPKKKRKKGIGIPSVHPRVHRSKLTSPFLAFTREKL